MAKQQKRNAQGYTSGDMQQIFRQAISAEGVAGTPMEAMVWGILGQESAYGTNTQTSNHGARGAAQILPSTFNMVADKGWDINNPYDNIRAGIRYLKHVNKAADGDLMLTAVGYYGGEGAIPAARRGVYFKDKKNPNAPDTYQYASSVMNRVKQHYAAMQEHGDALSRAPTSGQYDIGSRYVATTSGIRGDTIQNRADYYTPDSALTKPFQSDEDASRVRINTTSYGNGYNRGSSDAVSEEGLRLSGAQPRQSSSLVEGLQQLAKTTPDLQKVLRGRVPAAPITIGGRNVLAIPSTQEEKNFFTGVQNQPYDEGTKDAIIKGFAQLAPAREQLLGKQIFNTDPTDLDGYLRDIVENV